MAQPVPKQPVIVEDYITPTTSNGLLPYHLVSAATTNDTNVSAVPGRLRYFSASNSSSAMKYVKLYNKATAPVVGTDVPVMTFSIPAGARIEPNLTDIGLYFSAGIGVGISGAAADSDTTAIGAGDVLLNMLYSAAAS